MDNSKDLFADLPSAIPSTTLSHYTSLYGFLEIVRKSELWASNILFLNDSQEMKFGLSVAKKVVDEINKSSRGKDAPRLQFPSLSFPPDTYACCFCEEPDLLSQWRGYGATSQSVSIQFDADNLKALVANSGFALKKVVYGQRSVIDRLHQQLGNEPSDFIEFIRDILLQDVDTALRDQLFDLAPEFKDEHFKDEREWRIVVKAKAIKNVQHRVRDNLIIPYVSVSAPNGLPIKKVTIGPGKDAALTGKSVESFLATQPLYSQVKVQISQIPFRT